MNRQGYDHGYSPEELESWIPAYLSGSLDPGERLILERWLRSDPLAQEALHDWHQIQAAVSGRSVRAPRPGVWAELAEKLQAAPPRPALTFTSLVTGVGLALVSLMVLWLVIRPGILLRWSINEPGPVSYRLYRAPMNSNQYTLVTVMPARAGVRDYAYLDSLFVPGQVYIYRVEVIGQGDVPLFSQAVHGPTASALPGQLSILFASALIGLLSARLVQQRQITPGTHRRLAGLSDL